MLENRMLLPPLPGDQRSGDYSPAEERLIERELEARRCRRTLQLMSDPDGALSLMERYDDGDILRPIVYRMLVLFGTMPPATERENSAKRCLTAAVDRLVKRDIDEAKVIEDLTREGLL